MQWLRSRHPVLHLADVQDKLLRRTVLALPLIIVVVLPQIFLAGKVSHGTDSLDRNFSTVVAQGLLAGRNAVTNANRASDEAFENAAGDKIELIIGVKTAEVDVHGQRLPQIQKTWMKDAMNAGVDIKFFTHPQTLAEKKNAADAFQSNVIHTPCQDKDLCCKNQHMFSYYLEHSTIGAASYFCSFDDDNYVLVSNLLRVLSSYHSGPTKGKNIYLGRSSWRGGVPVFSLGIKVAFGTGGAGYCLSRDLVEQGREWFTSLGRICKEINSPDDVVIGYVVQEKAGAELITDNRFNSHMQKFRRHLDKDHIFEQVSFGYNNKFDREKALEHFPHIPVLFPAEDDPMLFRSLWCFLNKDEHGVDTSECNVAKV